MTSRAGSYFLVVTREDVEAAAAHREAGLGLIAGTCHIANRLASRGLDPIADTAVIPPSEKPQVVSDVDAITRELDRRTAALDCPEGLRISGLSAALRALFSYKSICRAERNVGGPILRSEGGGLVPARNGTRPPLRYAKGTASEVPARRPRPPRVPYELDLLSSSGKKLDATGGIARVHLHVTDKPAWTVAVENVLRRVARGRRGNQVAKLNIRPLAETPAPFASVDLGWIGDPEAEAIVSGVLSKSCTDFYSYRSAARAFLARHGAPERLILNHVGNDGIAGFVAAFHEAGVPCEMSSHGCLVDYGEGPRHRLARLLGNTTYNTFPEISRIVPRSPLQARGAYPHQEVVGKSRVPGDLSRPAGERPFRVYCAPNFLPWHKGYHGMTIDCFDTLRCIEAAVAAIRGLDGVELDLRIKTTVEDRARSKTLRSLRGLHPEDVAHLIDPEAGIHDASVGSHSGFLHAADLVITEGMTAVMFEALELRRPLLLLSDGLAAPSLPATPASDITGEGRSAVYAATPADDLGALLTRLADAHRGSLLTDAEISPYVWVA